MSALDGIRARAGGAALLGAAAAAALLLWAVLAPARVPLAGWLVGFVFWIGVALGALALLAVGALTGGRWGAALRPAIAPAAGSLPLFLALALPLLIGPGVLYPWAAAPGAAGAPDVARWLLNAPGFAARTLGAVIGWSAFAWWLLRRPNAAAGGLGLAFHFAAISLVSVDWMLSLAPRFTSTAFGLSTLLAQILAALAWAAVLRPEAAGDEPGRAGDLGGLFFAAALGSLYLGFSEFIVTWYGNLPEKAAWYVARQEPGWAWLQGIALLLSSALPLGALLPGRVRRSPRALAWLGLPALLGIAAHLAWIVAPAVGPLAVPAAVLGLLAVGGLWIGAAYGPLAARLMPEAAHGG